MELNFPLPKHGLHFVASFQSVWYGKGAGGKEGSNFTVKKPDIHCYFNQVIRVNINSDKTLIVCTLYMMRIAFSFCGLPSPNP